MSTALNHGTISDTLRSHASALKQLAGAHTVRILLVDDDESVLRYLDRVLRDAGFDTTLATNGAEGLDVARTAGVFDLLLTDLRMPQMMGDELARHVRALQPDLKVLYLTGYSDQLFDERITLQKDEGFLDKPCSVDGLLQAISQLLWDHTCPQAALPAPSH